MPSRRRVFILLYTASGAAALVYEVAWTRLLTLQLGHTVAAASTVLAAFMGGLAVGAWIAGRLIPATRTDPIRLYAALEIAIAVCAVLLPFALSASTPLLAWAYADGGAPVRFGGVRVAISLILVGIPAAAMGATYPLATEWIARKTTPDPVASAGALYAANTAGAALGALSAGFWLIPALGLRGTTAVGMVLNATAAAGAVWLAGTTRGPAEWAENAEKKATRPAHRKTVRASAPARRSSLGQQASDGVPARRSSHGQQASEGGRLAYVMTGVSGFSALAYEVAWTRLLAMIIGPTTYAFATMAAAFIGGLAIGSAIGTRVARTVRRPAPWLAAMLIAGALAAVAAAWFAAARLPLVVAAEVADPNAAFGRVILKQAAMVMAILLPMTLALGAAFPLAVAVARRGAAHPGAQAARVYAANTVGAIAGALAAGFLLIPAAGLRSTFQIAAITSAGAGAICLFAAHRRSIAPVAVGALAVAAILMAPPWDRQLLASGAYKYAPYAGPRDLDVVLRAGTLEYYKEGAAGTVNVRRLAGTRSLAIDGKVDASNAGDMLTQRLLGLLPVLLHGSAKEVCIIGLGSGVTAASALAPGGVERADVVEISPEVVEASRFFDRESGSVLSRPEVRLIVGDGRSHLLLTPRRYDVIVSEPSNPWMAGVAALFTREFFEAARARLKPDGLLCQWAHTYDISQDDLRSIVRTFASVFPQGTMWLVGAGDLLLIGTNGDAIMPRLEGLPAVAERGATRATLATVGVDPEAVSFSLFSLYAGGPAALQAYAGDVVGQTDDRMALEFTAPRSIYGRTVASNDAAIRKAAGEPPPVIRAAFQNATSAAWTSRGTMLLKAEAYGAAFDAFRQALAIDPRNRAALHGLSDAAAGAHREAEERQWLTEAAAREPDNAAVRLELSRVLASAGEFEAAIDAATAAVRLAPDDPLAGEQLASIVADAGDGDRLAALADSLVSRFPGRPDPLYYRATALFLRGRTEDALDAARSVVAAHPNHSRAQNLLGAACATLGRRDCAQAAFEASLRADPRDPGTYVNVGTFWLQHGDPRKAANYFAEALTLDPQSLAATNGLSQARAQMSADPR